MSAPSSPLVPWPYPRWIAHRGAGKLAPENTLAAFRLGAAHGYRMFECDAKLSSDGVPFLMHDATLERTTNGRGTGGAAGSTVHGRWTDGDVIQFDDGIRSQVSRTDRGFRLTQLDDRSNIVDYYRD